MATRINRKKAVLQARGDAFVRVVLDVALEQLAQVGFDRLTIPQVAEQAGFNKTSIYRRWPDKTALVRDALGAAMSHTDDPPDTGNLRDDLIELARTVASFIQSPVGKAVVRIMLSEGGNPQMREMATMAYGAASGSGPWVVIERATKRGELSASLAPTALLFTLAGAIMHRVLVERQDASDEFLKQVIDLMLLGAALKR
jgi:AcrR family transcriptional regulator